MKTELLKKEKARKLRYKKAVMLTMNFDSIKEELYDIMTECEDIRWFTDNDEETLLNALDGDEEDAYEFKMTFFDLAGKCEKLDGAIRDSIIMEHFDDFMVGMLGERYSMAGYDGYEEDYYGLLGYEANLGQDESIKRLMRLKKEHILGFSGQCLGLMLSFLDIRYKYDYLKATFDIIKGENTAILQAVRAINEAYEKANANSFDSYSEAVKQFDALTESLPEECWLY